MISLRAYAKRRAARNLPGSSATAVSLAIRDGRLLKSVGRDAQGNPKIADPDLADREWADNSDDEMRVRAAGGAGAGEAFANWHVRKEAALAQLRETELARERGKLIEVDKVLTGWADMISAARTCLLSLPSRLREAGLGLEASAIAERVVREALEHLAGDGVPR